MLCQLFTGKLIDVQSHEDFLGGQGACQACTGTAGRMHCILILWGARQTLKLRTLHVVPRRWQGQDGSKAEAAHQECSREVAVLCQ